MDAVISHPAHTLLAMPTAVAPQVHTDLAARVAPMGERHFRTDPTHTVGTTDYTVVRWPVRESVAAALLDLSDDYADLSIVASPTPYADVDFPPMPDTPETGRIYDDGGDAVLVRASGRRTLRPRDVGADWRDGDVREHDGRLWLAVSGHTASLSNQPPGSGPQWSEIVPIEPEEPLI